MGKLVTLEELLALPTAEQRAQEVMIDGLGTLRIRPPSLDEAERMRAECWQIGRNKSATFDQARWQALLLTHCVIEPALSFDDAKRLRRLPSGIVDALFREINGLAGLTPRGGISEAAVEEAEASFRDTSDESDGA